MCAFDTQIGLFLKGFAGLSYW